MWKRGSKPTIALDEGHSEYRGALFGFATLLSENEQREPAHGTLNDLKYFT
jgi:hypothetical protein